MTDRFQLIPKTGEAKNIDGVLARPQKIEPSAHWLTGTDEFKAVSKLVK